MSTNAYSDYGLTDEAAPVQQPQQSAAEEEILSTAEQVPPRPTALPVLSASAEALSMSEVKKHRDWNAEYQV